MSTRCQRTKEQAMEEIICEGCDYKKILVCKLCLSGSHCNGSELLNDKSPLYATEDELTESDLARIEKDFPYPKEEDDIQGIPGSF